MTRFNKRILPWFLILAVVIGGVVIPEFLIGRMREATLAEGNRTTISVDQIHPFGEETTEQLSRLAEITQFMKEIDKGEDLLSLEEEDWSEEETEQMNLILEQYWDLNRDMILDFFDISRSGYAMDRIIIRTAQGEHLELGAVSWSGVSDLGGQFELGIVFDLEMGVPMYLAASDVPCRDKPSEFWDLVVKLYSEKTGLDFFPLEVSQDLLNEVVAAYGYDSMERAAVTDDGKSSTTSDLVIHEEQVAFNQYGKNGIFMELCWNRKYETCDLTVRLCDESFYAYLMGSNSNTEVAEETEKNKDR